MRSFLPPSLAAGLLFLPLAAEAATMQAVFTGTVSYYYDGGTFGGAADPTGETATLTYLYDPDLALPDWKYTSDIQDWAYGGDLYGDYDGLPVPSPVIATVLTFGDTIVETPTPWYGYTLLTQVVGQKSAYFDGRSEDTYFSTSWAADGDDLVLDLHATQSFSVGTGIANISFQDTGSYLTFNFASFAISPYAGPLPEEPEGPAPVPLPAAAPLLLAGIGALLGLRRRIRRPV